MTTRGASIRPATPADRRQVVQTLVRAFADDPLLRWFFPDDTTWDDRGSRLFGYFFDVRIETGRVTVTADVVAAALWTLPHDGPEDDRWVREIQPYLASDELARLGAFGTARAPLHIEVVHWYLGALGVHPDWQRRGFGSAVVQPVLAEADAVGLPTFLETATEGDVAFYRTLGYDVSGEIDVPDGPHVWGMFRPAAEPDTPHFEGV